MHLTKTLRKMLKNEFTSMYQEQYFFLRYHLNQHQHYMQNKSNKGFVKHDENSKTLLKEINGETYQDRGSQSSIP